MEPARYLCLRSLTWWIILLLVRAGALPQEQYLVSPVMTTYIINVMSRIVVLSAYHDWKRRDAYLPIYLNGPGYLYRYF